MSAFACDRCGRGLLTDAEVRYQVKILVTAAYDPLEITAADLDRDHRSDMDRLLAQLEGMDPDEVEASVHKEMHFDLCATCHAPYLTDPLGIVGGSTDAARHEGAP